MKFTLKERGRLMPVYNFAKNKGLRLYLVGGVLRDLILKRERLKTVEKRYGYITALAKEFGIKYITMRSFLVREGVS